MCVGVYVHWCVVCVYGSDIMYVSSWCGVCVVVGMFVLCECKQHVCVDVNVKQHNHGM